MRGNIYEAEDMLLFSFAFNILSIMPSAQT